MTEQTPLAKWIDEHVERAGGDIHVALATIEAEIQQQATEMERASLAGAAPAAEAKNAAHAREHTRREHVAEKPGKTGENGTALDSESRGGEA